MSLDTKLTATLGFTTISESELEGGCVQISDPRQNLGGEKLFEKCQNYRFFEIF